MNQSLSQKLRFIYLFSMIGLVFIHGNTLDNSAFNSNKLYTNEYSIQTFIQALFVNGLLRFRIPLLMMISGYLLANSIGTPFKELMVKKMRSLLLPYILISAISLLFVFMLEEIFFQYRQMGLWGIKINEYGPKELLYHLLVSPNAYQLWYLKVIFIFILSFPIINYLIKRVPILFITALFIFWILTDHSNAFKNIRFYFFFVAGFYLHRKKIDILTRPKWFSVNLFFGLFLAFALAKTFVTFCCKDNTENTSIIIVRFLFDATVITGIIYVWFGLDHIIIYFNKKKWFHKLTRYSFFIYAFHAPLINLLMAPYFEFIEQYFQYQIIVFITLPIIVITICMLLDEVVRTVSPIFYCLLTGDRGNSDKNVIDNASNMQTSNNTYLRINEILEKRYRLYNKSNLLSIR